MNSHKFKRVLNLAPVFLIMLSLFAPLASFAQSDSVAIILRAEKVLIQINEAGSSSRLQSLFDVLGAESDFLLLSADKSVKLDCGRDARAATCVIRLLPSPSVNLGEKTLDSFVSWNDLRVVQAPVTEGSWMFESSRGDHLEIQVTTQGLRVFGNKR